MENFELFCLIDMAYVGESKLEEFPFFGDGKFGGSFRAVLQDGESIRPSIGGKERLSIEEMFKIEASCEMVDDGGE